MADVDLFTLRLLCVTVVAFAAAFSLAYHLIGVAAPALRWAELALVAGGLAGLAASYRLPQARRRLAAFVRTACYVATFWFVGAAALQQFTPPHAVGLLFIVPGLGAVYSLSLRRVWPLAVFFVLAVVPSIALLAMVPRPGVDPVFFGGAMVGIALVTFVAAGARLRAASRFAATEERYRAVVEQASDGIYLVDARTLRFLDANPSFQRMVGYGLDELRTMALPELFVDDGAAVQGDVAPGERLHVGERLLRRRDGRTVCAELHIDRIMYGSRAVLSAVVHDVSLRKQYEDRLIVAKDRAEEIARFRSSLLTNMSHEIRTPLSSILGWSAVLTDEVTDTQRELVALIQQSGQRLHTTLDAVLELAHLDANVMEMQPVTVDVAAQVQSVLDAYGREVRRKQLSLALAPAAAPLFAHVDAASLHRIVTHVVDNAVKFTEEGSIRVHVEEAAGGDVVVCVEDTGVGIGPAFLPHVFDEFRQESQGLARAHEGTGLGLTIARRLAELQGGAISVESTKGEGTRVTVTLPGAACGFGEDDAYRDVA